MDRLREIECLKAFLMKRLVEDGSDHKERVCEIVYSEREGVYAQC
jgi:hypothetical protein